MATEFEYASLDRVEARGPDATAFLHAQLASDVAAMADGSFAWSSYLTPQGRTIAVFLVARRAQDAIDLLVPAGRGAELAERLQRFVFRSKVKLTSTAHAFGAIAATLAAPFGSLTGFTADGDGSVASIPVGDGVVLVRGAVPDEGLMRAWAVRNGVPLLAGAAVEAQTPHALGLDRLGAISTRKGCYPGQEIVARTHFLGRNKRHLVRWRCEVPFALAPGAEIKAEDGTTAAMNVLTATPAEGPVGGLAVAHEQAVQGSRWVGPAGMPVSFELVSAR